MSHMAFSPEWMRKTASAKLGSQSNETQTQVNTHTTNGSANATYSALVSPVPPVEQEKRDPSRPFRYSKEDMLRIYREGGGKGGLGLEVERWDGIVRASTVEPANIRGLTDAENKVFLLHGFSGSHHVLTRAS